MKKAAFLLSLMLMFSCKSKNQSATVDSANNTTTKTSVKKKESSAHAIKPYNLNSDYAVIDTGCFDATVLAGTYAVIKSNNNAIDTIDKDFGMQKIGEHSYLFASITDTAPPDGETTSGPNCKKLIKGSLGNYIIVKNNTKQDLNKLIENFNEYFSSPSVIEHKIYFWQLKKLDTTGKTSVSAAEYDPVNKTLKSHYVKNDFIETDDNGYFPNPYLKKDTIYFDGGQGKLMKYSREFKPY
jgi:hypothetical protein